MPSKIEALTAFEGCASIEELLDRTSQALAHFPWLGAFCLPLKKVVPTKVGERFWIVDHVGAALPAQVQGDAGFRLLAASGGQVVDVAAEFDGQSIRPLSVLAAGRWTSLAATHAEAAG